MIDMHSHILPGVDDGAQNPKDSFNLLQMAIRDGVKTQVLTPHIHTGRYDNNLKSLLGHFQRFKQAVSKADLPIQIELAAEVRLDDSVPSLVESEQIPFLGRWKNKNVMLIEFPSTRIPVASLNLVRWLYNNGIIAMIAHPERNRELQESPEKIRPFIENGCMLQVTAGSLTGQFGRKAFDTSLVYLRLGIVTLLATDTHNLKYRPPILSRGVKVAANVIGKTAAERLVTANPENLRASLQLKPDLKAAV